MKERYIITVIIDADGDEPGEAHTVAQVLVNALSGALEKVAPQTSDNVSVGMTLSEAISPEPHAHVEKT